VKYMLDTDTCVYLIRKSHPSILKHIKRNRSGDVGISVISMSELEYGVQKSAYPGKNARALLAFLASFEVAPLEENAARVYGELRAGAERAGRPIGAKDLLIAAHARARGCVLVTNNEREFSRVPGLTVENWTR